MIATTRTRCRCAPPWTSSRRRPRPQARRAAPKFIEFLRRREFGQHIRDEGPEAHKLTKAGTPTMGGIIIVLAFAVPFLILVDHDWQSMGVFGTTILCALLGFADDYTKIVKR